MFTTKDLRNCLCVVDKGERSLTNLFSRVSCQYNRYKADKALEKAAMRGKKPSYGKLFGEGQSQTAVGATADGGLADH